MDTKSLLVSGAVELGIELEIALALDGIVGPVVGEIQNIDNLGLYYFNEARCVEACEKLEEFQRIDGVVLLWHAAQSARSIMKGSIGVDYATMYKTALEKRPVTKPAVLGGSRLFGGHMERPVAKGALQKLKDAIKRKGKVCKKMRKEALKFGQAPSPQVRMSTLRIKVTEVCLDLLIELGELSGLYCEMYGNGERIPSESEKEYAIKRFFQSQGRKVKESTIFGYFREFRKFLE